MINNNKLEKFMFICISFVYIFFFFIILFWWWLVGWLYLVPYIHNNYVFVSWVRTESCKICNNNDFCILFIYLLLFFLNNKWCLFLVLDEWKIYSRIFYFVLYEKIYLFCKINILLAKFFFVILNELKKLIPEHEIIWRFRNV